MTLGEYFEGSVVMSQYGIRFLHQPSSSFGIYLLGPVRAGYILVWMCRWDLLICKGRRATPGRGMVQCCQRATDAELMQLLDTGN